MSFIGVFNNIALLYTHVAKTAMLENNIMLTFLGRHNARVTAVGHVAPSLFIFACCMYLAMSLGTNMHLSNNKHYGPPLLLRCG